MTSFPGRGPPGAPPPGIDDSNVDMRALKKAGGEFLEVGNGVVVGGWRIQTKTTPIMGREQLEGLERRLGTSHLPEMVYGSTLGLTHLASGTRLHFNAEDALKEWLEEDLPPLKVAAAAEWARGHKLRFGDEMPLSGQSAASKSGGRGGGGSSGGGDDWDKTERHEAYDWTFTSPYRGSVDVAGTPAPATTTTTTTGGGGGDGDGDGGGGGHSTSSGSGEEIWVGTEERVDRGLLMERDPILFYDEMTLYESELDDNGEMSMSLKVRVMPRCWYVLMRLWMRVDGVLIRLRETRFFCRMSPPPTLPPGLSEEKRAALSASLAANAAPVVVVRESARREETFQALKLAGLPKLKVNKYYSVCATVLRHPTSRSEAHRVSRRNIQTPTRRRLFFSLPVVPWTWNTTP